MQVVGLRGVRARGLIDQADPFQDSIRIWKWEPAVAKYPAAVQVDGLVQDTPES